MLFKGSVDFYTGMRNRVDILVLMSQEISEGWGEIFDQMTLSNLLL